MLHYFPPSVDDRIREAIAERRLVEVGYKRRQRVVEPHDYGCQKGADRLLVYQLSAAASFGQDAAGWRLLDVSRIESLVVLDTAFRGSRRESSRDHYKWDVLYARVD